MITFHINGISILQFEPARMADLSTTIKVKHTDSQLTIHKSSTYVARGGDFAPYDFERIGSMILGDRDAPMYLLNLERKERECTVGTTHIQIFYEPESVEFADDAYISIEVVSIREEAKSDG